ncbi:MAG TPA: hypothetical protein VLM17_01245 [Xanthomonadaceae bacterium]|nr:hypothetical protein [Xanthomonadaceae bacterium]
MTRSTRNRGSGEDASTRDAGTASAPHQPLRRPGDAVEMDDALHRAGLSDRGASVQDHLRDRDSKGVADGYDDSIDRHGAH